MSRIIDMVQAGDVWIPGTTRDEVPNRQHGKMQGGPSFVVWHFTGGPGSPRSWLRQRTDGVCWHFTIERDGEIFQHAGLDSILWHAGVNRYNASAVGIELANLGPVVQFTGPWLEDPEPGLLSLEECQRRCFGRKVDGRKWRMPRSSQVYVHTDGSLWEAFSAAQQRQVIELGIGLAKARPALLEDSAHLGHSEILPHKKDPGPAFAGLRLALRNNLQNSQPGATLV